MFLDRAPVIVRDSHFLTTLWNSRFDTSRDLHTDPATELSWTLRASRRPFRPGHEAGTDGAAREECGRGLGVHERGGQRVDCLSWERWRFTGVIRRCSRKCGTRF